MTDKHEKQEKRIEVRVGKAQRRVRWEEKKTQNRGLKERIERE